MNILEYLKLLKIVLKRKQNPQNSSEEEEPIRYCPNCTSILQKWIFDFEQNDKAIKVPNKLQCLACGEIVTIYHPSSLS